MCPLFQVIKTSNSNVFKRQTKTFTDDSKSEGRTGAAFCFFREDTHIFSGRAKLVSENSLFQAELYASYSAIGWSETNSDFSFLISPDS